MTVVVGLAAQGTVFMGADSGVTDESDLICVNKEPKVVLKGPFLVGAAGLPVPRQLVESMDPPAELGDPYQTVRDSFAVRLRNVLKQAGFEGTEWELLVGYKGELFHIDPNCYVSNIGLPFWSIGSGSHVALGSMQRTVHSRRSPEWRVGVAIEDACNIVTNCKLPARIIEL